MIMHYSRFIHSFIHSFIHFFYLFCRRHFSLQLTGKCKSMIHLTPRGFFYYYYFLDGGKKFNVFSEGGGKRFPFSSTPPHKNQMVCFSTEYFNLIGSNTSERSRLCEHCWQTAINKDIGPGILFQTC